MRVSEYDEFVRRTNQFGEKSRDEQTRIAHYGLVSEIGSLVAAIKKKILGEGGQLTWDQPNDEIKEELGDALWYCFASAHVANGGPFDVLAANIDDIRREVENKDDRAQHIASVLNSSARTAFLAAAKTFPPSDSIYSFDDYQQLAFRTARTDGRVLLEVCLALLWQLGAELLRPMLPNIEITLNKYLADRPTNVVLGEIAWHLSAIASVYTLSLDDVVESNCAKTRFRQAGERTPLHDDDREAHEQFPRGFDVAFVRVGSGRSRMYFNGKSLGDDLTDNFLKDDGYRFHDVIHLALVAHLGWSPVIRNLMRRKRKSRTDRVDEIEDGGRAKVVEELVIKAIHSEGEKQAKAIGRGAPAGPVRLFSDRKLITFRFLKTLREYVEGLEAAKNTYREWEDAIIHGCEMFHRLCEQKQGTIHVDLVNRKLTFRPVVTPNIQGLIVGLGMGDAPANTSADDARSVLSVSEFACGGGRFEIARTIAAKHAVLEALGLDKQDFRLWSQIDLCIGTDGLSVHATGDVQDRMWALRAIDFKVAFTSVHPKIVCTAMAVADPNDVSA